MRGLALLNHSLRVLFGNLGPALRISLLLYVVMQGAFLLVAYLATGDPLDDPAYGDPFETVEVAPGSWVLWLGAVLFTWALGSWIAVRWHRFVLLEEYPSGALPGWDGGLVLAYMGRSLKIGLVLGAVGIGLGLAGFMLAGALGAAWPALLALVPLIVVLVASYVGLRISLGLPGAALGRDVSIADSWTATAPVSGAVAVLMVPLLVLNAVLSLVPAALAGVSAVLVVVLSLVMGWFALMLSVAVLTTLYGHLEEGRELA